MRTTDRKAAVEAAGFPKFAWPEQTDDGRFVVEVQTDVGGWTLHSRWDTREAAIDQADIVRGRVLDSQADDESL